MIKVLIVDDSKVVQEFMSHILTSDPQIKVAGVASSGREAIELARELRPDVITMDFHMPDMNGSEATRAIMETTPTPIVIVSGSMSTKDITRSFSLIEDGALAVVLRPPGTQHPDFVAASKELVQTVKLMSEIKVVKHFAGQRKLRVKTPSAKPDVSYDKKDIQIIAIGASTGGPVALQKILSGLPKEFPVPVLIVQHISQGFVKGFVEWLSTSSGIELKIASDGEPIKAGTGYVAPDGYHMGVSQGPVIILSTLPSENGLKPSVDHLFRSVAQIMGRNAIGVLLSGMGKDGAAELKTMKNFGAITIIQDEESSVIFGMPGEALKIGAADHVLSIDRIAGFLKVLVTRSQILTIDA
jgi:two-component system chemotaxis response regulator CheB